MPTAANFTLARQSCKRSITKEKYEIETDH
jgi:hypothetical protein